MGCCSEFRCEHQVRRIFHSKYFKDIDVEKPMMTIKEVQEFLIKDIGIERGHISVQQPRTHLMDLLPKSQEDLPPRSMQDSFSKVIIPLTKDVELQEKFLGIDGIYRGNMLIEEADIFAVYVANKHILNPKRTSGVAPHILCTVHVNDVACYKPLYNEFLRDLILVGCVGWVGKSSLEVVVQVFEHENQKLELAMEAAFLIAARNSIFSGPTFVNKLIPIEEAEVQIHREEKARLMKKIDIQRESLVNVVPNREEQKMIHDLYLSTVVMENGKKKRFLPPNSRWMEDAHYSTLITCIPMFHNVHKLLFAGYFLRYASSLSYQACTLYSNSHAKLYGMSSAAFNKPFYVGCIANMKAFIVYTEGNFIQVAVYIDVYSKVTDPASLGLELQFTYSFREAVPKIIPMTYMDAMLYIEGQRQFKNCLTMSKETGHL